MRWLRDCKIIRLDKTHTHIYTHTYMHVYDTRWSQWRSCGFLIIPPYEHIRINVSWKFYPSLLNTINYITVHSKSDEDRKTYILCFENAQCLQLKMKFCRDSLYIQVLYKCFLLADFDTCNISSILSHTYVYFIRSVIQVSNRYNRKPLLNPNWPYSGAALHSVQNVKIMMFEQGKWHYL